MLKRKLYLIHMQRRNS
ncbi:hypothetical protein Gogos_019062 [Gossypium gossypioides]|uniref:Uncharacterized protein n=1 Tax=Gossypium gossypioides TaxID=34282 RepID=A0A7J9BG97_GOSGO|nr:hypothetical protein [Gossypium gossypioides]